MGKQQAERPIADWAAQVIDRNDTRDWTRLPASFEQDKVRFTFAELKPHFPRSAVSARIAASKAQTFSELRDAVGRAGL